MEGFVRKIIIGLVIFAILIPGGFGTGRMAKAMSPAPRTKPLRQTTAADITQIIKSLLEPKIIYFRGSEGPVDLDNDGKEELVVLAYLRGRERPANAAGEVAFKKDGSRSSVDLMVLAQDDKGKYYFKAYYIKPIYNTSHPHLFLKDINSDNKIEIFVSMSEITEESGSQSFVIFACDDDKLVPVTFRGGHFTRGNGIPTFPGPNQLTISHSGVSETYAWNRNGYFELLSTTAVSPTGEEGKAIEYLRSNITDIVHGKPVLGSTKFGVTEIWFYPENTVLARFEDGHISGQFLGKYEIKGRDLRMKYLDEDFGDRAAFLEKHKLPPLKAKQYFNHLGVFLGRKSRSE
jgi:hypothetical protein